MGIQGFTKVFPPKKEIKYANMKNKKIIIDASSELYRAALGMSASVSLTDRDGNPTSHINTILLGVILKLKAAGAQQYWVFDYDQKRKTGETFHIQMKDFELAKRKEKKQKSEEKLKELRKKRESLEALSKKSDDQKSDQELFSSSEEETQQQLCITDELRNCVSEIDKHEKRSFCLKKFYFDDTIFMLNMLDIPWIMCPPGFEAEQLCAMATRTSSIAGVLMDYVLTPDADAIIFGATSVIKRDIRKKKFYEYNTKELLNEHDLTQDDLIKISLILGCDYAKKTPRVGIKTVMIKYPSVELSPEQKIAESIFKREITEEETKMIELVNANKDPFTDEEKYYELLSWLQLKKCFDKARIDKQFKKIDLFCSNNKK